MPHSRNRLELGAAGQEAIPRSPEAASGRRPPDSKIKLDRREIAVTRGSD